MKKCKQCGEKFEIYSEDRDLYDKVSPVFSGKKYLLPDPEFCPVCRFQRQACFRNEQFMYRGKSSLSGKPLVTVYSPNKDYMIYSYKEWWSEKWDAIEYGCEFDFNRSFFGQFEDLFKVVPKINLIQDGTSENCEYTNFGAENKNCYLALAYRCENVYYSWAVMSRDCVDCLYVFDSEKLYECVNCEHCYNSFYLQNSNECRDSYFLESCIACDNCLGCKNLRHKQYHIFNKLYLKDEYERLFKTYKLNTYTGIQNFKKKFGEFKLTLPFVYSVQKLSENSTGDFLDSAKNCHHCFKISMGGAEDCRYCYFLGLKCSDLIDCYNTDSTLNCGSDGLINSQRILYSHFVRNCSEIYYSAFCYNSSNLFGCTGLDRKEYCILNKQYSREEYEELVPRVVEHMIKMGEWGVFFPPQMSAFGYNETYAYAVFPMGKTEVLEKGFQWSDYEQAIEVEGSVLARDLPETIDEVNDDILKKGIICEETGKPFRLVAQELNFYRKMDLPLPHLHYDRRALNRYGKTNPYKLWDRECNKCGVKLQTAYAPDRPEKMYCEKCYLGEVY